MNRKKTFESDLARLRGGTLPSKTSWDSETFQQVVQWYHLSLYRYYAIHTNGDLHFAKNLTGETFSVVYHKPVSFEKGTFSSWFFGLAWDVLHEHYARPGSEMRRSKGLSADRSTGHEPGPNHTELLAILKILSTLTFYSRETLCLRLFAELSIKEIAMLMDKRPVTVKTLVYQGMTEFASRMEGVESTVFPRQQLLTLARSYHLYLEEVSTDSRLQQQIDPNLARATNRLLALREALTMNPEAYTDLVSKMEQVVRSGNISATRL